MYTTGCVPASIRRHLESVEGLADRWASFSAAELSFFCFVFLYFLLNGPPPILLVRFFVKK